MHSPSQSWIFEKWKQKVLIGFRELSMFKTIVHFHSIPFVNFIIYSFKKSSNTCFNYGFWQFPICHPLILFKKNINFHYQICSSAINKQNIDEHYKQKWNGLWEHVLRKYRYTDLPMSNLQKHNRNAHDPDWIYKIEICWSFSYFFGCMLPSIY